MTVVRHASALGIDVIVTDHHLPEFYIKESGAAARARRAESQSSRIAPIRKRTCAARASASS